jgi:hypothetical protein
VVASVGASSSVRVKVMFFVPVSPSVIEGELAVSGQNPELAK